MQAHKHLNPTPTHDSIRSRRSISASLLFVFVAISIPTLTFASTPVLTTVAETPDPGGQTQYTVTNSRTSAFDISIFLSTTTGSDPTTTNTGWTAESLDADSWTQDMPGEPLTWQQFTGLTYIQAFPPSPVSPPILNAYFLDYSFDTDTDAITFYPPSPIILPDETLGGFYFQGSPSSTFFVAGPAVGDASFAPGNVDTFS